MRGGSLGSMLSAAVGAACVTLVAAAGAPAFDCWSISNVDRRSRSGAPIPAGKPFHEQDDALPNPRNRP